MSHRTVHDMDVPWISSNPAVVQTAAETTAPWFVEGSASTRISAQPGSLNATVSTTFVPPLDLGAFDELRYWLHASRRASGAPAAPFLLDFSYTDTADLPGEQHRWFVPVNEPDKWEHRRIGIGQDRRTSIAQMQFRCLTDTRWVCRVDELLAVREDMLADLEEALIRRLEGIPVPGLASIPLASPASGAAPVVLPPSPGFAAGNQVLLTGGSAGNEIRDVLGVVDTAIDTQLTLATPLVGLFPAATATVSLRVPPIVEVGGPGLAPTPSPALVLTPIEVREDLERTGYRPQRDSFRLRGTLTVCSTRPAARAYWSDYQIVVRDASRARQMTVQTAVLQRLSIDIPLRINGVPSPVSILPAPPLATREFGTLAPVYVRIGTRMEVAPRVEEPWIVRAEARSAPKDAPLDQEGIVIRL